MGNGFDGTVSALAVFDADGPGPAPRLFAGGWFTTADGVASAGIAQWDGNTWGPVVGGVAAPNSPRVEALVVHDDDGPGPHQTALYAGGVFTSVAGQSASCVAKWDGASWSAVGSGTGAGVYALASFDPGGGATPLLIAGGWFTLSTPSGSAHLVAAWNGTSWAPMAQGFSQGNVRALAVFDEDGPGGAPARLFAGGALVASGSTTLNGIARWDGSQWSALGSGLDLAVGGLLPYADPAGPALYATGYFTSANGLSSAHVARRGCSTACYSNCDGSTAAPVLNINDFTCFLNRYAAGDSYANCDNSTVAPVLNVNDFTCFLNRYAAGCP